MFRSEDLAGPLAAPLADALGLPGHPLLSIGFSRNKIFTREVCMEAGIPSPRFFRIKSADDLGAATAYVGFPSVLKPISGVSSVATFLVKDEDMLRQRYQQTISTTAGHLKLGLWICASHKSMDEKGLFSSLFSLPCESRIIR